MRFRTDRRLAAAAQSGDRDAAEELARRHADGVWKVAYSLTGSRDHADEVFQETFLRAFRAIGSYDVDRPFGAWLYGIVLNCARDARAAGRGNALTELPSELADGRVGVPPEEALEIGRALAGLDPERRQAVVGHLIGLTAGEIARAAGVPEGTARSRIARGLADLRARLRGTG